MAQNLQDKCDAPDDNEIPEYSIMNNIVADLDKVMMESSTEGSADEGDSSVDSELPSIGSEKHYEGLCRPCAHNWKATGCSKGRSCTFCHLCGEKDFMRKRKDNIAKRRAKRTVARKLGLLPGWTEGDERVAGDRSDSICGGLSEDSDPMTSMSGALGVPMEPSLMSAPIGGNSKWAPLYPSTFMAGEHFLFPGGQLDTDLLGGSVPPAGMRKKAGPTLSGFEEQDTATPSSSEEGQELRTPPSGPKRAPALGLARPFYPHGEAAYLPTSTKTVGGDAGNVHTFGEPARVEPTGLGMEAALQKMGENFEQPTYTGRHSFAPMKVGDPMKLGDHDSDPAWVPISADDWQEVPLAVSGGYGFPQYPPSPCFLSEVQWRPEPADGFAKNLASRPPPGLEALNAGLTGKPLCSPNTSLEQGPRHLDDVPDALKDESTLPSVGSVGHAKGMCRPCAHIWKPAGCSKGQTCEFCHICGEEEFQRRRKDNALRRKTASLKAKRVAQTRRQEQERESMFLVHL